MYTFRLLLSLVNVFVFLIQRGVNGASLSTSLSSGVCLCVNEPNVAAIKDRKYVACTAYTCYGNSSDKGYKITMF